VIIFIVPKNSGLKNCKELIRELGLRGEIVEVRGEDVPLVVLNLIFQNKKVIGITGEDLFKEFLLNNKDTNLEILNRKVWQDELYIFKKPSLCLLGPKGKSFEDIPKNFKVCINSKYKEMAKKYCTNLLENQGYKIEKIYASGATEEFFSNKIVDLVIDIVCSGKSAKNYGLRVYNKLFESDIVVIGKKQELMQLDFSKMLGLIPTIIKDENGRILSLLYSNEESLRKTIEERKPYFYSRERQKVCLKGETSGNTQKLIDIKTDCDRDALLFIVKQKGSACHLNNYSCFLEEKAFSLRDLYEKILDRMNNPIPGSYTNKLFSNPSFLRRKIVEESGEVITEENRENLIGEFADLIYNILVYMALKNISMEDIEKENQRRDKESLLNQEKLNKLNEVKNDRDS
jgi:phosphoribosyl-AMP cyclohydrolase / phosphoribosyl-ATP pyrophosphohydrolase